MVPELCVVEARSALDGVRFTSTEHMRCSYEIDVGLHVGAPTWTYGTSTSSAVSTCTWYSTTASIGVESSPPGTHLDPVLRPNSPEVNTPRAPKTERA